MKIHYDTEIEVSKEKYNYILKNLLNGCACCEVNGKYYVKLWDPWYKDDLRKVLKSKL